MFDKDAVAAAHFYAELSWSRSQGAITPMVSQVLNYYKKSIFVIFNILSPGPIETPILDKMGLPKGIAHSFGESISIKRLGRADEMASSYVVGTELMAYGGLGQV